MVGSRFPFRDPNRRADRSDRDDSQAGNRPERDPNRRDDAPPVNRPERDPNRRDETASGNRPDRSRETLSGNRPRRPDRPRGDEGGEPPPAPAGPPTGGAPDLASLGPEVEALIRLMAAGDVSELQIERGGLKIMLRRGNSGSTAASGPAAAPPPPAAQPAPIEQPAVPAPIGGLPALPGHGQPAVPALAPGESLVTSPMVGTYYAASEPTAPPYVGEGDAVAVGQTIGIIEAMKMYNPIEAEIAGRVARILVRDGQGVEYGQPLMVIAEG